MVIQQDRLSELQTYETTGAQLDSSVTQLSDAIVDGRGQDDARRNLRAAISAHSSAAFALRSGHGSDYPPYMAKLVEASGLRRRSHGCAIWG
jgi:hypothetical protein